MILLVRLQFALQISNEGHAREGAEEVSKGRKRDKEGCQDAVEREHHRRRPRRVLRAQPTLGVQPRSTSGHDVATESYKTRDKGGRTYRLSIHELRGAGRKVGAANGSPTRGRVGHTHE